MPLQGSLLDPTPLLRYLDAHPEATRGWEDAGHGSNNHDHDLSTLNRSIRRWREGGRIHAVQADNVCAKWLGVHMSEIFSDYYREQPAVGWGSIHKRINL